MAINTTTITKNIGYADIYVDCVVPADRTPMALAPGGLPVGGRYIGATQGEALFRYTPTIEGVEIEQVTGMVAPHMVSEEVEITFTMMELDYQNMLLAIGQGSGTTAGGVNLVTFGGNRNVPNRCVCLVAKSANEDTYDVATIYQAINTAGVQRSYQRGQARGIAVTFRAVQVHTRSVGDRAAQLIEDAVPAAA